MKDMRSILSFLLITLIFFNTSLSFSDDSSSTFQAGVDAFQKSQFEEARKAFQTALSSPKYRFSALYNLGNTAYRQQKFGEALAYYRLAENLKPRDSDLRSNMQLAQSALRVKGLPGPVPTWETFRNMILTKATIDEFLVVTLFSLAALAVGILRFLRQKKANEKGAAEAPRVTVVSIFSAVATLILVVLTVCKAIDDSSPRATVVAQKVEVRSGPAESNASLYELHEGLEVYVETKHDNWLQVTYPGGLTGWIPESAAVISTGRI